MFPSVARVTDQSESGPPDEVRARAVHALSELVRNLGKTKPVVVYVDDLQWGDEGGVRLLGELLATHTPLLLVVGSRAEYRGRSPALRAMDDIARAHAPSVLVELARLDEAAATALVGAVAPALDAARVAWVVREAEGNAFFLQELARAAGRLGDTGPVRLDALLRERVGAIDAAPRALLEACALAARPLPLGIAAKAVGLTTIDPDALVTLRHERLARSTGPSLEDELETFHDRVREAVVALLPPERRRALHAALARTLATLPSVEPEALAAHHEAAGEREEARVLYLRAAEVAARALAFERAELFLGRALQLAEREAARAEVRERRIHLLTNLGRFADAYIEGRTALAEVGIALPEAFSPPVLLAGLARLAWLVRGRDAAALSALREAREPRTHIAVRLLAATMKAAYQVRPELCVTLANTSVALCLRDGNTPDCAIGYMVHGAIFQGGVLGRHAQGNAYGELVLSLVERYQNSAQRAEVSFVVGYFATAWRQPAEAAEALFQRALAAGLESGDDFHVGCAAAGLGMSRVMRGAPPTLIIHEGEAHLGILRARRLDETVATLESAIALTRLLHDAAPMPEVATDAVLAAYGSRHFAHFQLLAAAIAAWHAGDEVRARGQLERAEALLPDARGMLHSAEHVFWQALSRRAGDPPPGPRRAAPLSLGEWTARELRCQVRAGERALAQGSPRDGPLRACGRARHHHGPPPRGGAGPRGRASPWLSLRCSRAGFRCLAAADSPCCKALWAPRTEVRGSIPGLEQLRKSAPCRARTAWFKVGCVSEFRVIHGLDLNRSSCLELPSPAPARGWTSAPVRAWDAAPAFKPVH
jgi:tetratricopeptide (TPR) repeat protein